MATKGNHENPLNFRGILAYAVVNLGFLFLISLAADLIQIFTFDKYGLKIFLIIVSISTLTYIARAILYFIDNYKMMKSEVSELKKRMSRLSIELSVRSPVNPNPGSVNAWVTTKKYEQHNTNLTIQEITSTSIIVSKGAVDGLVNDMAFNLLERNSRQILDQCTVEAVYDDYASLAHSGSRLNGNEKCENYFLELVYPPISNQELILAKLLLFIQGIEV